jgi:hypothetical protein
VVRLLAGAAGASGVLTWVALWVLAGRPNVTHTLGCALPCIAVLLLAHTSPADRKQYLLRLLAAVLMLPPLMQVALLSGTTAGHAVVLAGLLLLHLAGFAGLAWRLAPLTTRIDPAEDVRPVSAPWLGERLRALHAAGLPWTLRRERSSDTWVLTRSDPADAGRAWALRLFIDEAAGEVRVRERVGGVGARPQDAAEASLRGPGDATFDPCRPAARRGWSLSLQATLIEPEALAAVRLHLHGPVAEAAPGAGQTLDELVHLLAALVTRSGWAWQPTLRDPAR